MKVDRGRTVMALRDGTEYECRVLDLSLGGTALEVNIRPPVGELVSIGQTEGRVVRHTNEGVAVEFQGLGFPVRP
jgi:PilZ domain-containing protein